MRGIMQIDEIKSLILWCKTNKVKKVSLDNISFELSDLSFFKEDHEIASIDPTTGEVYHKPAGDISGQNDLYTKNDDEDLLFWSSKK